MHEVQVSEASFRALELAARLTGMTPGGVVDRLVMQSNGVSNAPSPATSDEGGVPVYADYNGQRVRGLYNRLTKRIDITSGPLTGTRYKSPSAAARAVVSSEKPGVNSNRNGWGFWLLDDGSGNPLQTIRYDA